MYMILKDENASKRLTQEAGLREKLEDSGWGEHDSLWLYEANRIVVGCADVTPDGNHVEVHWISILPEERGKGYGRMFVEEMTEGYKSGFIFGDALPESARFWQSLGAEFFAKPGAGLQPFELRL